ncbi:TPA: hypothetical protein N0F65_010293 [Lagenidium giganteum]|uniref:NFX1-type zinc finger-containing protein 1 n=1 Tax=Lagenidium giganteum TaxID=4803 RepID=A0AAV2Z4N2_9STRA|nr:TPA: hypothetical protein N0F65_010293 [Lagenidium giganteum]
MARIPVSCSISPPPLSYLREAVEELNKAACQGRLDARKDVALSKLHAVELVEQVLQRLFKFFWSKEEADDVRLTLEEILGAAEGILEGRLPEHRRARERLGLLWELLEKPWTIQTRRSTENDGGEQSIGFAGWRQPTVAWLLDWSRFQPLKLPRMSLPTSRSSGGGVYESVDEYFDIVLKIWIGMTFGEGNNALMPHCTEQSGSKICDQVLLPLAHAHGNCRSSGCRGTAEFVCPIKSHTSGLCKRCELQKQNLLRAPRSNHASTHMYDATVASVNFDGTVYVENVLCRHPPAQKVQWKTTRRLACPNLVGLVPVATKGSALRLTDPIYWGQIAFHGQSREEFRCRENGKLAVQLLEYGEPGECNPLMSKTLESGAALVVIDCQTFAPEYFPVLKSLEQQRDSQMPFQRGKLLNLCRTMTADGGADVGDAAEEVVQPTALALVSSDTNPDLASLVSATVWNSTMQPIVQIRRDPALRVELAQRLMNLVMSATLDDGQLASLVGALTHPVHCTQGPPGTGKSYLGIVLVQALLIIRQIWVKQNPWIGTPPVLVLSYKNHAIDEFLLDLIDKEPMFKRDGFKSLVRIGGGGGEPSLFEFRERQYVNRDPEVTKLAGDVDWLHKLACHVVQLHEKFKPIHDARALCFDDDKEDLLKEEAHRKTLNNAATTLCWLLTTVEMVSASLDNMRQDLLQRQDKSQPNTSQYVARVGEVDEDLEVADIGTVKDNFLRHVSNILSEEQELTVDVIYKLHNGIGHSDEPIALAELLLKWINGFAPTTVCVASGCDVDQVKGEPWRKKYRRSNANETSENDAKAKEAAVNGKSDKTTAQSQQQSNGTPLDVKTHDGRATSVPSTAAVDAKPTQTLNDELPGAMGCDEDVLSTRRVDGEEGFEVVEPTFEDNADEIEESEYLQHLREVYEVEAAQHDDDDDYVENYEREMEADGPCPVSAEANVIVADALGAIEPKEWTWDLGLSARWQLIMNVLQRWASLGREVLDVIREQSNERRQQLHVARVRAKSKAYEGKAVIGGTLTGCAARLDSIRMTNPFAIVVEEASEVLEPILMACIGSTACKLEMIGDHLQLRPSTTTHYQLERINGMDMSLFERLVRAPPGYAVPMNVLAVQRRMRKNICDLTRTFYRDITAIQDDAVCATKTIARCKLLDRCETRGREVPGIQPHLFFWRHSGAEQKATVGLSRINPTEAEMACRLASYLVHCGVPSKSIAMLTPYKGQLMLLRKKLVEEIGMVEELGDGRKVPSCIVSTVDRFQGDEADLVIVSLVIDGKSKTPFVKLQNRMIVLLSRARIGMYIIGNAKYFQESSHWQTVMDALSRPAPSDSAQSIANYAGPRAGEALPLCCPRHRHSTSTATTAKQLRLGFCKVVCSERLPCSHGCDTACHWPRPDEHRAKCVRLVSSPCHRHPRDLPCHAVTSRTRRYTRGEHVVERYDCDAQVSVHFPCGHDRQMQCWKEENIVQNNLMWPACTERAWHPYNYPTCKHELMCSCTEYSTWTARGMGPPCVEPSEFVQMCGHSVRVPCHQLALVRQQPSAYPCKMKVEVALPRCGHVAQLACSLAQSLRTWSGGKCAFGIVKEGQAYGPKDVTCRKQVTFVRQCGHESTVKCETAFEHARSAPQCEQVVKFTNPECGHRVKKPCHEARRLGEIFDGQRAGPDDFGIQSKVSVIIDGDPSPFADYGLRVQCMKRIKHIRSEGDEEEIACHEARSLFEKPTSSNWIMRLLGSIKTTANEIDGARGEGMPS